MARATRLHYDTARRLALTTDAEIFIAHYPLAPKHNVRDALTWLEMFYLTMLQEYKAKDIVFMGDSAGANLVLSLTARVSVKPGGLIVISPACGLENGTKRDIRKDMEPQDPILSVEMNDTIAENWCRDVPLDSPDISPEYIDHGDFPPILMFYGSHELFYPLVNDYVTMLKTQKVRISTVLKPMCHDWALCSFFPEGREAVSLMSEWIRDRKDIS
jgi:acetyl esterase/lipase